MSTNTQEMLSAELPNGSQLAFESPEALARAVAQIKAGTPVVVRDVRDGSRAVVWAPEDHE